MTNQAAPTQVGDQVVALWLTGCKSANTRRQYARAPQMLERFTGKPWPLTSGAEMQRFNGHLIEDLHLSAATRSVILSALSSLYNFGMKMREGDGSVACETNPVLAIERPEVQKFGKVGSLDVEQIKALLRDIQHKISRSRGVRQVVHLRNLAMVQFYLYTGKRNVEVSRLRWGQIRRGPRFAGRPEKVEVLWETKGGETRRDVLPEPVWATTWAYLEAAQRTGLREDDYLFIALEDPFDAVQAGKPITDRMVRLMLGRYAKGAGLTHVTVHMLRHSSAMLMKAVGASAMDIQAHLGHSHLNTTQIYLDQLESYENKHWTKVADLLRLASDNVPYRRDGTLPHEKRVLPKGYPPNIRVSKMGKEKA